jgi:hypothetical protein
MDHQHVGVDQVALHQFRPILRMYEPDAPVFDGSYELAPITRTD